jgi:sulfonate transport system permease protein
VSVIAPRRVKPRRAKSRRPGRRRSGWLARLGYTHGPWLCCVALILVIWWIGAETVAGNGLVLPDPFAVARSMVTDWWIIGPALQATVGNTLRALLWGTVIAVAAAVIAASVRPLRTVVTRQLTLAFCLPLSAIAPLVFLLASDPGPQIILGAISTIFPVYITVLQGLTGRHRELEDVTAVLGGGRIAYFLRVQVPAASGQLLAAARLAVPAAVLGVTLGEYFGGTNGIGVLLLTSAAQLDAPRAYALGLVVIALCSVSYLFFLSLERRLPWAATSALADAPVAGGRPGRVWLSEIGGALVALVITFAAWWVAYLVIPANTYLVSPFAALRALGSGAGPLLPALGQSAVSVLAGYCISVVVAFVFSAVTVSSRFAERAVMPLALLIGSVPITVVTPLLPLILGRGTATTIAICAIVSLFPGFVSMTAGMRSVPGDLVDYVRVSGGSRLAELFTVRVPAAVPSIVSAGKLTLPAALSGVILAEVIATGTGIGNYINFAKANFDYAQMWAGIVAALVMSVLAYAVLAACERALVGRYGSGATASSRGRG